MLDLGGLDVEELRSAFMRRVEDECPSTLPVAASLWERISPRQWTLEWHVSRWLGDGLALDRAVSNDLVLSNVFGLGSLRLQDDLIDGEIGAADRSDAAALGAVLYAAAVDIYHHRLPAGSVFWTELERRMSNWRASANSRQLAERGAPLKLCALAICELAGRMDLFPTIEACLDEALTAMVLYDHVCDWQADLDAGRWNAFVDAWATDELPSHHPDHVRATVYAAMLARGACGRYFGRINRSFARAIEIAGGLAIPELTDYLRTKMADIDDEGQRLERHYSELGNQAAVPMLAGLPAG